MFRQPVMRADSFFSKGGKYRLSKSRQLRMHTEHFLCSPLLMPVAPKRPAVPHTPLAKICPARFACVYFMSDKTNTKKPPV